MAEALILYVEILIAWRRAGVGWREQYFQQQEERNSAKCDQQEFQVCAHGSLVFFRFLSSERAVTATKRSTRQEFSRAVLAQTISGFSLHFGLTSRKPQWLFLYTTPPFITNVTCSVALMSCSGLP